MRILVPDEPPTKIIVTSQPAPTAPPRATAPPPQPKRPSQPKPPAHATHPVKPKKPATHPGYYTYKNQVPLKPGQTLAYTPGKGYYAKRTPTKPAVPAAPTPAPAIVSEHGLGGGTGASDTGKKPTKQETKTGYPTPAATQPQEIVSEHGEGGGSSASDTGKRPTKRETKAGYATPAATQPQDIVSEHGRGGGSGASGTGKKPAATEIASGYVTPVASGVAMPGDARRRLQAVARLPAVRPRPGKPRAGQSGVYYTDAFQLGPLGTVIVSQQASATVGWSTGEGKPDVAFNPRTGDVSVAGYGVSFTDPGILHGLATRWAHDPGDAADLIISGQKEFTSPVKAPSFEFKLGGMTRTVTIDNVKDSASLKWESGTPAVELEASTEVSVESASGSSISVTYAISTTFRLVDRLRLHLTRDDVDTVLIAAAGLALVSSLGREPAEREPIVEGSRP